MKAGEALSVLLAAGKDEKFAVAVLEALMDELAAQTTYAIQLPLCIDSDISLSAAPFSSLSTTRRDCLPRHPTSTPTTDRSNPTPSPSLALCSPTFPTRRTLFAPSLQLREANTDVCW